MLFILDEKQNTKLFVVLNLDFFYKIILYLKKKVFFLSRKLSGLLETFTLHLISDCSWNNK